MKTTIVTMAIVLGVILVVLPTSGGALAYLGDGYYGGGVGAVGPPYTAGYEPGSGLPGPQGGAGTSLLGGILSAFGLGGLANAGYGGGVGEGGGGYGYTAGYGCAFPQPCHTWYHPWYHPWCPHPTYYPRPYYHPPTAYQQTAQGAEQNVVTSVYGSPGAEVNVYANQQVGQGTGSDLVP